MKATQTLPSTYILYRNFRPSSWRVTHWVTWIFGVALAGLSLGSLRRLAEILRPEFQPKRLHLEVPTLERLGSILVLILFLAIIFAVHELIHAIFLWFFTGHRPTLVAGGGGLALRLPSWYIPRDQFLVTNLAPFCLMSLAGLLLLPIVPQNQLSLVVFLTAMNMAGSIADITSSAYLLLHPRSIYVEAGQLGIYLDGRIGPNSVPAWKLRIRSSIEAAIARLDPRSGPG